ncbi:F0F1 ATP synthase subunit gamma [Nannocystis pusilla]|uniref:F0F1 ATP synthase subunit gamma n=1 Tax=Nannocystis pusilla TaxID=889268 RepID=UPI003B76AF4F
MANLKEIRNRITSVKNTRKITSAMSRIAAARLVKAQQAAMGRGRTASASIRWSARWSPASAAGKARARPARPARRTRCC